MRLKIIYILILFTSVAAGQNVLDDYIRYGLDNNLALKQKEADYKKSIEALREARGLFYPDISFQARYTVSEGGRVIEFPVGDLLNPVYLTLNQLTSSQMFPLLENQEILFLRPHEQETKLRLIQPVINPDIYYNSRIKKELTLLEESDVSQYKRELRAEIRKAYYNVAMADGILSMLKETRSLLLENIRVNKKLIENQKVTMDYLYRSQAELSKFDQELQNAGKNRKIASAYFNFLLNRPLGDSITIVQPDGFPSLSGLSGEYTRVALENREELQKLESYNNIAKLKESMESSGKIPDLSLVVDYGLQGTEYRFNREEDYVQASALLSWNLFKGFQNRSKIRQAAIDREIAERQLEEARKQIELQVLSTISELLTAEKGIAAAESRLKNANEGFRLVSRKYEEGQATQIEYLDARSTMTQAASNLIISKFTYLSAFAEFEKVAATSKQE
ncbi:MAG TPA: TolC family protein [Bacteroidales bacterium]|nr:TolC family protein [Bacteroidales bacterium]